MSCVKLTVDLNTRYEALSVAGALTELLFPPPDAQTMFEAGKHWRVEAYFGHEIDEAALTTWLIDATGLPLPAVAVTEVRQLNWVTISQAALSPVRAGRFFIHGAHDRARAAHGPHTIEIAAGEAFGTAHHATTRGCLEAIDRLTRIKRYSSVLDLGCGTGILALAASRALPHARIRATDIDPIAITVAAENARLNGAGRRITFACADGLPAGIRFAPHDLVIANILAQPLVMLAPVLGRSLRPGTDLVLSGILVDQARTVVSAYRAARFKLIGQTTDAGWAVLVLTRCAARPRRRRDNPKGEP